MRKVVIAMLSSVAGLEPPGKGGHRSTWSAKDRVTGKEVSLEGAILDQAIEPKGKMPSITWQQTLRAAYHHNSAEPLAHTLRFALAHKRIKRSRADW